MYKLMPSGNTVTNTQDTCRFAVDFRLVTIDIHDMRHSVGHYQWTALMIAVS